MNWNSADDIDWSMLETRIDAKLEGLFASPPNPVDQFDLVFWIDINGGLNFDVYQKLPDNTQVRFSELVEDWNDEMSDLDELFVNLLEEMENQADDDSEALVESVEAIEARLKGVVKRKCEELANTSFGYPEETTISWSIR